MKKHLNIKIFGQVQGVAFRYYSLEKARELNLAGFARNEPDGGVYLEAEGEEGNLKKFITWCRQGPALAKVEKVEAENGEMKNYKDFAIKY
ncbi:MAG: acylphosphatase [Patescibacteria group bacterium]|nr:acylphosphatase [Patescibacteria group bacterium]